MRKILILAICLCSTFSSFSQNKKFSYKFYGFVRGDLYYDSRDNVATVDDIFYLFPKDINLDPNGKDLNANPSGSFYSFTSRLGLDVIGPDIWGAKTSAKLETDFGGFSISTTMLRIRQAYVDLKWEKSSFLIGQTWHPLFGEVSPTVLSLSTGAPFQPFNRSPQFRYQYTTGKLKMTASALYQLIYLSIGPDGKSEEYIKNSLIPELFIGADYSHNDFLAGAGVEMLSLKPRTESVWNNATYKVNERITTVSFVAQAKYKTDDLLVAAKTIYGKNLCHTALIGGYGISSVNPADGSQEYTPFAQSTSWINAVYGKKYQTGMFLGYTKNLGSSKKLVNNTVYGSGLNIDQLITGSVSFAYVLPHWKAGLEYNCSAAYYGDIDLNSGKVKDTHCVVNHRIVGLIIYYF